MCRVFQPRLFAYRVQQHQKKKTPPLVIQTQGQLPVHFPVLDSKSSKSHYSASRISLSVSFMIHLILFIVASFYVIDKQYLVEESHVVVDITTHKPQRPRIRRRSWVTHAASVRETTFVPRVRYVTTTAAQIPVAMGEYMVLPAAPLSMDEQLTRPAQGWEGLSRYITPPARQVNISRPSTSAIPIAQPHLHLAEMVQTVQVDILELNSLDVSSRVIPLSEVTRPPSFIHKVVPKYPPLAKRAGREGVVILTAEIGVDGKARNIEVVQGLGYGCDEAAIAALRAARFSPAYKGKASSFLFDQTFSFRKRKSLEGEHPVTVRIQIPYRFKIEGK